MASDTLVIVGPTASGKTAVAVEVARRLATDVISIDSRQVYRGMDIGTAKPTDHERAGVPHHGFDLVDPSDRFNAGRFAALARAWIAEIRSRGRVPVLAGGTGFFLRALTQPMFEEPELDPVRKEAWKSYLADLPGQQLDRWARALGAGANVRSSDRQRLSRVIEIATLTGRSLDWWQRAAPQREPAIDPDVFVLDLPRDVLRRRIEERVHAMIDAGLVGEVAQLMEDGFDERAAGMNATGYIELIPHVRGQRSLDEAVAMIVSATRQYARRQLTWLRHQLPPASTWLDARAPANELADAIVRQWSGETA
jgi:tRNA dimethylallyltransferase